MEPVASHEHSPDVSFDGGDLDCGGGLLLLIRKHIDPMRPGQLLEILSTEISVDEDLPAWCRLTKNDLVSWTKVGRQRSFLVRKGGKVAANSEPAPATRPAAAPRPARQVRPAPVVPPMAVTGMGSWPRPRWMLDAMHGFIEGRVDEASFHDTADDAVRLVIAAQERAGADLITDGEQRRDSYAAFIASRLDNCQLIPLTDLAAMVEAPDVFAAELAELEVPADLRHPAVFGKLKRSLPLVAHEYDFAANVTAKPIKVALPGPYLLTRTMWLECLAENAYASREDIGADIVQVLREELAELIAAGVAIVQFDEPVLSEVVFRGSKNRRSFMCGALSESHGPDHELAFARDLINAVIEGFPRERIALHVCRGNWSADESVLLAGSYQPLLGTLAQMRVGAYLLEASTPRAGDLALLKALPEDARIGVGVCNQKLPRIETAEEIAPRIRRAIDLFGSDRLLLHPDCGFSTFCDIPLSSAAVAEGKLAAIVAAKALVKVQ